MFPEHGELQKLHINDIHLDGVVHEKEIKERDIKTKEEYIVALNETLNKVKTMNKCKNAKINIPKETILD